MSDDTSTYAERMREAVSLDQHEAAVIEIAREADATIASLRDRLKAYEDWDASGDDAHWESPHPIFQMAKEIDNLRAYAQRLVEERDDALCERNNWRDDCAAAEDAAEDLADTIRALRVALRAADDDLAAARQRIAELEAKGDS